MVVVVVMMVRRLVAIFAGNRCKEKEQRKGHSLVRVLFRFEFPREKSALIKLQGPGHWDVNIHKRSSGRKATSVFGPSTQHFTLQFSPFEPLALTVNYCRCWEKGGGLPVFGMPINAYWTASLFFRVNMPSSLWSVAVKPQDCGPLFLTPCSESDICLQMFTFYSNQLEASMTNL